MSYDGWKQRAPEDEPGYDLNHGAANRSPRLRSHEGTEVMGCDCHHCEDTREFLRVSLEAMVAYGGQALLTRCDRCEHWIVDGEPNNGRIGKDYVCESCWNKHPTVQQGRMAELDADTRRGK